MEQEEHWLEVSLEMFNFEGPSDLFLTHSWNLSFLTLKILLRGNFYLLMKCSSYAVISGSVTHWLQGSNQSWRQCSKCPLTGQVKQGPRWSPWLSHFHFFECISSPQPLRILITFFEPSWSAASCSISPVVETSNNYVEKCWISGRIFSKWPVHSNYHIWLCY